MRPDPEFSVGPGGGQRYSSSSQLHDVKNVEDCSGVFELVISSGLVPGKGVQRRDFDPAPELVTTGTHSPAYAATGTAGDQIQQPGLHRDRVLSGEVHHPGQGLRAPSGRVHMMPNVIIDPEILHPSEASLVSGSLSQQRTDGLPSGVPINAELSEPRPEARGSLDASCPVRRMKPRVRDPRGGSIRRIRYWAPGSEAMLTRRMMMQTPAATEDRGGIIHRGRGSCRCCSLPRDVSEGHGRAEGAAGTRVRHSRG